MKTKGILLIACLVLLLRDASLCGDKNNRDIEPVIPLPNVNIDDYVFGRLLGYGTHAEVKLATHKETKTEFAVKIINTANLTVSALLLLRNEVPIMEKLKHPNILKLFGSTKRGKQLYLLMEYAPGGDLFAYVIKKGILDETEARRIFRQIIEAVEYCHYMEVAHRDLKPENFLLDAKNNIKLADFGYAEECEPGEKLKTFPGSLEYAAPELQLNKPYDGPRADVWSLGVNLYVLVTSSIPIFSKYGTYNVPPYVSQECKQLMARFLELDPEKRPTLRDIILKKPNEWLNIGYEKNELKPYDMKKRR